MPLILPGNVASATAGAYEVANSCRFNLGDSPDMLKNLSSGSRTKWTFSTWFKRSTLSSAQYLFRCILDGNSGNYTYLQLNASDQLRFLDYSASNNAEMKTNRLFRDVSAWYHVVIIIDTTDGTAGDRQQMWINGVRETSFASSSNYSSSFNTEMNVADYKFNLGYDGDNDPGWWDGYLAETVFIDGTDYAATSFGEFDEDSPTIWKPKDVSGLTFGTNGFYLDFEASDNLGNDANGGTDLTETNLDATDQATDTPTNNFCTMNPLDNFYAESTFSQGNCYIVTDNSNYTANTATFGLSAGKWYWEITERAHSSANDFQIGVTPAVATASAANPGSALGYIVDAWAYMSNPGNKMQENSSSSYGDSYTDDDVVGVALDLDNNKLYFAKNNTWQDSGDPTSGATGTGAISLTATPLNGVWFPAAGDLGSSEIVTYEANFGGVVTNALSSAASDADGYGNFEFAPPSGYFALCTKNLAEYG